MRHGQTTYNVRGLCNDDPSKPAYLTELGRQQAQQAAEQLRDAALQTIFVSELPRTRQTADAVNRHHQVPIIADARLNDIRSGFDSLPVADYFRAIAHDRFGAAVNGGESVRDHKYRVMGFIDWLVGVPETSVLVVAHEETLRVFKARFDGLSDEAMLAVSARNGEVFRFAV